MRERVSMHVVAASEIVALKDVSHVGSSEQMSHAC